MTSPIALVAEREIRVTLRRRSYWVMSLMSMLAVLAAVVIPSLASNKTPTYSVAVTGAPTAEYQAIVQTAATSTGVRATTQVFENEADATDALRRGDVSILWRSQGDLVVRRATDTRRTRFDTFVSALATTAGLHDEAVSLGTSVPELASILAASRPLPTTSLEKGISDRGNRQVFAVMLGALIYIIVLMNGVSIAVSVVQEKTSRLVEMLIPAIRPRQLLAGKIVGIGIMGLVQVVVVFVPGAIAGWVLDQPPPAIGFGVPSEGLAAFRLPAGAPWLLAFMVGWVVIAYLVYAVLYTLSVGAVSRSDGLGTAVAPVNMCLIASYVFTIVLVVQGDSSRVLARVLSIVPLTAPMFLPTRMAMGTADAWEVVAAAALMMAFVVAGLRWAGAMYARTILPTSNAEGTKKASVAAAAASGTAVEGS